MLKRLLPAATHLAASLLISTAAFAQTKGGRANVIVQPEPPGLMVGSSRTAPRRWWPATSMKACCATIRS